MSNFEWTALGLILFGLVAPFWAMVVLLFGAFRSKGKSEPSDRYFAYARLLDFLRGSIPEGGTSDIFGPLMVATIRELRGYPEYADLSILYLEEFTVNGSNKFDRVMEKELRETEAHLLGLKNV